MVGIYFFEVLGCLLGNEILLLKIACTQGGKKPGAGY